MRSLSPTQVSALRSIAEHGLIAPRQYTSAPGEAVIEWEITEAGRAFLRGVDEAGELAS